MEIIRRRKNINDLLKNSIISTPVSRYLRGLPDIPLKQLKNKIKTNATMDQFWSL